MDEIEPKDIDINYNRDRLDGQESREQGNEAMVQGWWRKDPLRQEGSQQAQ